jgi:hypothetical protein
MKRTALSVIMSLGILMVSMTSSVEADVLHPNAVISNLTVVRRADNTLWSKVCSGDTANECNPWIELPGRFKSEPSLAWDSYVRRYIIVGTQMDGRTYKATFEEDGTFNNNWQGLKNALAVSPPTIATSTPEPFDYSVMGPAVYDQGTTWNSTNTLMIDAQFIGILVTPGIALGEPEAMIVYIPSAKRMVKIGTGKDGLGQFRPNPTDLWFESSDCSGEPWMTPNGFELLYNGLGTTGHNTPSISTGTNLWKTEVYQAVGLHWMSKKRYQDGVCVPNPNAGEVVHVSYAVKVTLPLNLPYQTPIKLGPAEPVPVGIGW